MTAHIPPSPKLTTVEFRNALGRFATGKTVVTTVDGEGAPYGVTATSFASLSLDPALIQWSLRNEAYSLPNFLGSGRLAVNILSAKQADISRRFATPDIDRFAGQKTASGLNGIALISGAVAWIEYDLEDTLSGGDHTVFVGRVLRTRIFEQPPLLHWRGSYLPITFEQTEKATDP